MIPVRSARVYASLLFAFLLAGCSQTQPGNLTEPLVRHSSVHGGQQPISGSTLHLYAVGTTGDGSAATSLLTQTVTSDTSGNFSLTGAYTCPTPSTLVYVVATGGNPGLSPPTSNNIVIALMAALGPCGSLTSSTFITINELTTVAAIYPLAPFMSSYTNIGSAPGDASALAIAFTLASQYVNTTTGAAPGQNVPSGTTVPVTQLNTLANILSGCVNSYGGHPLDGTSCGTLLAATTPFGGDAPGNTAAATLNIANNPTKNVFSLYQLAPSMPPFQPSLSASPTDWTVQLAAPAGLAISPTTLAFPTLSLNATSAPMSVTLTNNGAQSITLSFIAIQGANPTEYSLSGSTCAIGGTLAAAGTCTISMTFTPNGIGTRTALLNIVSTAPNASLQVPLSGSGQVP